VIVLFSPDDLDRADALAAQADLADHYERYGGRDLTEPELIEGIDNLTRILSNLIDCMCADPLEVEDGEIS
jgi:hypothetical protein